MKYFAFQPKLLWQFSSVQVFSEKEKIAMDDFYGKKTNHIL